MKKPGDHRQRPRSPRRADRQPATGSPRSPKDDWLEYLADQLAQELLDGPAKRGEDEQNYHDDER